MTGAAAGLVLMALALLSAIGFPGSGLVAVPLALAGLVLVARGTPRS